MKVKSVAAAIMAFPCLTLATGCTHQRAGRGDAVTAIRAPKEVERTEAKGASR